MVNEIFNELFEDKDITVIFDNEQGVLFEIYSTGMALGHVKTAKNKYYPRKDRIDKNIKNAEISTVVRNGQQFINEEQLYDFMLEAKTDKCKTFRKWVTKELLPKLRQQGYYIDNNISQEQLDNLQCEVDRLQRQLSEERVKKVYGATEIVKHIHVDNLLSSSLFRYMDEVANVGSYKVRNKNRMFKYDQEFINRCCAKGIARVGIGGRLEFYIEFANRINSCPEALKCLRRINGEEIQIRQSGIDKRSPF